MPLLGVPVERLEFERVRFLRDSTVLWCAVRLRMRIAALGQVVDKIR